MGHVPVFSVGAFPVPRRIPRRGAILTETSFTCTMLPLSGEATLRSPSPRFGDVWEANLQGPVKSAALLGSRRSANRLRATACGHAWLVDRDHGLLQAVTRSNLNTISHCSPDVHLSCGLSEVSGATARRPTRAPDQCLDVSRSWS